MDKEIKSDIEKIKVETTPKSKKESKDSSKKTAKKTKKNNWNKKIKKIIKNPVLKEAASVLFIVIGIIILMSVYMNNEKDRGVGAIGNIISQVLKGLFGLGAYIIPFVAISVSMYIIVSKTKKISLYRFTLSIMIFLVVISISHIFSDKAGASYNTISSFVKSTYSTGSLHNGGLIGAVICDTLIAVIGKVCTYIIFVISLIILTIMITGKPMFNIIDFKLEKFMNSMDNYKDDMKDDFTMEDPNVESEIKEEKKRINIKDKITSIAKTSSDAVGKASLSIKSLFKKYEDDEKEIKPKNKSKGGSAKEKGEKVIETNNSKIKVTVKDKNEKSRKQAVTIDITPKDESSKENKPRISLITDEINEKRIFGLDNRSIPTFVQVKKQKAEIEDLKTKLKEVKKREKELMQELENSNIKKMEYEVLIERQRKEIKEINEMISSAENSDNNKIEADIEEIAEKSSESENIKSKRNKTNNENIKSKRNKTNNENIKSKENDKDENIENKTSLENTDIDNEKTNTKAEHKPSILRAEDGFLNEKKGYIFPSFDFLIKNNYKEIQSSDEEMFRNSRILEETLKSFGVEAKVEKISKGPTVTRYEIIPGVGTRISKIKNLEDDIALSLAAKSIRIEAPIPGKKAIGIEISNKKISDVYLSEIICDEKFQRFDSKLAFGLGKDITGNVIVTDIAKMPHILIAGATGSGKSVCINTLITSILYKASPEDVRLILIDPKVVELNIYNGIPHLLIPVVTEPEKAAGALNWAVQEMMERYNLFAEANTRNLKGFNEYREENKKEKLPQIVIIIDELADLMMVARKEVEESICRIAQLARAAGIHIVIATQRPSVDIITGLIKANILSRIAFAVSSSMDSRTILDIGGAEKLLGKGDMLFRAVDMDKPLRVQGAFISDKEVEAIVNFIKEKNPVVYDENMIEKITTASSCNENEERSDDLTEEVIAFVVKKGKTSVSMIQRQFKIGHSRAVRIMEELQDRGIVSSDESGSKQKQVLMDKYEWQQYSQRKKNN